MLKKNPKLQKLFLAAMLQHIKDSSSSSTSSNESSDDEEMSCGRRACSSPLNGRGRHSPELTTSAAESGDDGEAGGVGGLLDSPTMCPDKAEEEGQISLPPSQSSTKSTTDVACEEEWMTENHSHSPTNVQVIDVIDESDQVHHTPPPSPLPPLNSPPQESAAAVLSDAESVILHVSDEEVRELMSNVGEPGDTAHPAPVAGTSSSSSSSKLLLPTVHQPPAPTPRPVSTYTDKYGITKLVVDPSASPFLVRNQMLERGLHHLVSYDQSVIEKGTSSLRPCVPFQNGSCHRIIPVHGSASTDLMFSHICILCLYKAHLPLPHPLIECPFVSDIKSV